MLWSESLLSNYFSTFWFLQAWIEQASTEFLFLVEPSFSNLALLLFGESVI